MSLQKMASGILHGEFYLPPEFLTEDDILTDFKPNDKIPERWLNPRSGISSPVESTGSYESEEEDYLAQLNRKMAKSSVVEDFWKSETHKSWGISVSPQSTLSGFKQDSSRGRPNCLSPPTRDDRNDSGWELLYAAAGEVAKMRMLEETNAYYQSRRLNPVSYQTDSNVNRGFLSNQSISYQQLQIAKFQQLRREQMMRQQVAIQLAQAKARANDRQPATMSTMTRPTIHQSFQPQSQQQPATAGSGMRAVFLGNTGPKRESSGTGVFIPRRVGDAETRKSSGCSTVLLPDRVVQALNLNLEAIDAHSLLNNALTSDVDGAVTMRNNVLMGQQQKNKMWPPVAHSDLRLPQEWTY